MAIVEISDQSFEEEVHSAEAEVVLVDFWAPWCGPCKTLAPILEDVDQELGEKIKIVKVNVDSNPETAGSFGVMSIPTLMIFKKGELKPVAKMVGSQPKEQLIEWLGEYLQEPTA